MDDLSPAGVADRLELGVAPNPGETYMSSDIIYDTNFYSSLEAEVNAFREALTD